MRKEHDQSPDWFFTDAKDKPAFSKGTIRMDRADIEKSLDLFYEVMGWDKTTGAPTAQAYKQLGLASVAEELAKSGLLPK